MTNQLSVLDIFSGIGGFSLGLERTGGFETKAFCEVSPFCRKVLAKHWPEVPCYEDIRSLTADALARDGIGRIDVICGGFPCQDVSFAGKRAGLEGARSGLWSEYRRLICEIRPRYVIVENVPGLLNLGMGAVLGDLSSLRYDAVWDCVPASALGAPHQRDRVWIIAYASGENGRLQSIGELWSSDTAVAGDDGQTQHVANAERFGNAERKRHRSISWEATDDAQRGREAMADAVSVREPQPQGLLTDQRRRLGNGCCEDMENAQCGRDQSLHDGFAEPDDAFPSSWWSIEPDVGRVVDGLSAFMDRIGGIPIQSAPKLAEGTKASAGRVHRLSGLGNAVVHQIPELIGHAILQAEAT